MSARLRATCESGHVDGSRTARSGIDSQNRGSNGKGRRGRDAPDGGSGDERFGDVGISKRVSHTTGARNHADDDGVPKVGVSFISTVANR